MLYRKHSSNHFNFYLRVVISLGLKNLYNAVWHILNNSLAVILSPVGVAVECLYDLYTLTILPATYTSKVYYMINSNFAFYQK